MAVKYKNQLSSHILRTRTHMAWVRTSPALISFGFSIAMFFEPLYEKQGRQTPLLGQRTVGILMIALGLVNLVLSNILHGRAVKALHMQSPGLQVSMAYVTELLLGFIGILELLGPIPKSL